MTPTFSEDQLAALNNIKAWYAESVDPQQVFRLGGLAGTGKTTITASIPDILGLQAENDVAFAAPTGKAAKVLSTKLAAHTATTVHRLIYRPIETHCTTCPTYADEAARCHGINKRCPAHAATEYSEALTECGVKFRRVDPFEDGIIIPKLIVVDEASMVDEYMFDDLTALGSRLLFVGDHGQLPPVNGNLNLMAEAALDFKLDRIHRQAEGSLILKIAYGVREGKPLKYFRKDNCSYGPRSRMKIDWASGTDATTICYTNRTRNGINRVVRRALNMPDQPTIGERVICLRNNQEKGIVNGSQGTISQIENQGDAYQLTVDLPGEPKPYEGFALAEQFGDDATLQAPRDMDLWTYAYALTCHKAQGSEADDVIIIKENFHPSMSTEDRIRWLYTAVTRAKQSLTIIDWSN
jgi:exodeoxyribonuclease-5